LSVAEVLGVEKPIVVSIMPDEGCLMSQTVFRNYIALNKSSKDMEGNKKLKA